MNKEYLLDTSAIFAFTDNEPGAEEIESLLKQAKLKKTRLSISLMSIMELYYITCQEKGESDATKLILLVRGLPLNELPLSEDLTIPAAQLKSRFKISVADAWIAATAKAHNFALVHKDPELESLKEEIEMYLLEYKL